MVRLHDIHIERLRLDERALADSARQLANLDGTIQTLQKQIEEVTLDLRAAVNLRVELAGDHSAIHERVQAQRRVVAPFSHCSTDVLAAIFMQLIAMPDVLWTSLGSGIFNEERARAPFIVAAVSRHWRAAALRTAQIWDYAGLPDLDDEPSRASLFVDRVRTVISRSGAAPLDVLFQAISSDNRAAYDESFELLYRQLYRWRRCEIWCRDQIPDVVRYLRGRAPAMEELCIGHAAGAPNKWVESGAVYLSDSSKLRIVHMQNAALALDLQSARHPHLQHVTLVVSPGMPSHLVWNYFNGATQLVSLDISLRDAAAMGQPPELVMHALRTLKLRNGAARLPIFFPDVLGLRQLRELVVDASWSGDPGDSLTDMRAFLSQEACSQHLHNLTLANMTLRHPDAELLAEVARAVNVLSLDDCVVDSHFWNSLRTGMAKLEDITLTCTTFDDGAAESFLDFVRQRTFPAAGHARVLRPPRVVLSTSFSARDQAELERLFSR